MLGDYLNHEYSNLLVAAFIKFACSGELLSSHQSTSIYIRFDLSQSDYIWSNIFFIKNSKDPINNGTVVKINSLKISTSISSKINIFAY